MSQGIEKQIGVVPPIESERHFFEVGLKMLCAQLMPATAQAALEKGESGFDGVGVGIAANVLFDSMPDHLVFDSHALCDAAIHVEFIGEQDFDVFSQVLAHELFNGASGHILGMKQPEFTIPLPNPDNGALLGSASAPGESLSASADIGFINFDLPVHHGLVAFGHCSADSVAKIPSCLVASDSERALNLTSGHSFFRFAEQQRSEEPFRKRQVRVIEDRASHDAELIIAILTVVERPFGFQFCGGHVAARAAHAFRPAQTGQEFTALFIGREHGVYIN